MELNLYFVSGINRVDTLYFSNLTEQNSYYDSKLITRIEDFSFYPPHYRNTIRLTTDDINFNSKINYLSLVYNDKRYYYFIDNIEYVSEDIVSFDITMDVIQTYQFDINFINYDVKRRTIDRWKKVGTTTQFEINRDYVRENLSEGVFFQERYKELSSPLNYIILDVVSTEFIANKPSIVGAWYPYLPRFRSLGLSMIYTTEAEYRYFSDGYFHSYVILPLKNVNVKYTGNFINARAEIINDYDGISYNFGRYMTMIDTIAKMPSVVSINLMPAYSVLDGLSITTSGSDMTVNVSGNELIITSFDIEPSETGLLTGYLVLPYSTFDRTLDNPASATTIHCSYNIYTLTLSTNRTRKINYNDRFIPQLIDENYINIEYGERISTTTFPLHELTIPSSLVLLGLYLINNGNRAYIIGVPSLWTEGDFSSLDRYRTCIVVPTTESLAVKNDAWEQYLAQNRATLTTGMAYTFFDRATNLIMDDLSIKRPKQMIDRRFKKPTLNKAGVKYFSDLAETNVQGYRSMLGEAYDYHVNKENLRQTPNTITQGNNAIDDLLIYSNYIYYAINKVRDYSHVGELMEEYGFKVSEHYGSNNPFDTLNTRLYYNYFELENVNITLNILNDENTLALIIDRLNNGLRLWNVNECETDNLEIGNLFVYDNVEKSLMS